MTRDDVLNALRANTTRLRDLNQQIAAAADERLHLIAAARSATPKPASWSEIGDAIGQERSNAYNTYNAKVAAMLADPTTGGQPAVTALTITADRAELLRAIDNPDIEVYAAIAALRGSWSTADVWLRRGGSLEQKVTGKIRKLETAGLVKRGQPGVRYHEPRHYTLTEDGRKALAEYNTTDGANR